MIKKEEMAREKQKLKKRKSRFDIFEVFSVLIVSQTHSEIKII